MTKPTKAQLRALFPSEEQEDIAFLQWCGTMLYKWPELRNILHIHNEGRRGFRGMARLMAHKKYLGGQAGIYDWCLPVRIWAKSKEYWSVSYNSLYIEMKRQRGAYANPEKAVSPEQKAWGERMTKLGHKCVVAYGWEEAAKAVEEYLG